MHALYFAASPSLQHIYYTLYVKVMSPLLDLAFYCLLSATEAGSASHGLTNAGKSP